MNSNPSPPDDSWESDAVWDLLDQSTSCSPSPRFAENVVRAARLLETRKPWWKKLLTPAPIAGLAAAAAALAIVAASLLHFSPRMDSQMAIVYSSEAVEIQEIAETEALIVAVDQMEDFTDNELVSLIGF